jgi:hypothetical protein
MTNDENNDEQLSALMNKIEELSELLKKNDPDYASYTLHNPVSDFALPPARTDAATESPTPDYARQPLVSPEPSHIETMLGEPVKKQVPKNPMPPPLAARDPRHDDPSQWRAEAPPGHSRRTKPGGTYVGCVARGHGRSRTEGVMLPPCPVLEAQGELQARGNSPARTAKKAQKPPSVASKRGPCYDADTMHGSR